MLEALEPLPGIEPELLDEQPPPLLVDVERLGLPARAVEGEHQLSSEAFAKRLPGDKCVKLGDELRVPAQREVGVQPLLDCAHPEFFEAGSLDLDELDRVEIGKRLASPQVERLAQPLRRGAGLASGERSRALGDERLELA